MAVTTGKLRGWVHQPEPKQREGFSTHAQHVRLDYHGTLQLVCLEENWHTGEKIERVVLEVTEFRGGENLSPAQGALFWALVGRWVESGGSGVDQIMQMGWTP